MSLAHAYLEIVVSLGRLVPAWVESYAGPRELIDAVDVRADAPAERLRERAQVLAERVRRQESERDRRSWLLAQLRAISAALLWLGGERIAYAALFERCHGASVELVPDRQFEQAHALLDGALPGQGDVAARYRRWRDTQLVPRERLQASLELLSAEMRGRCRELFGLPPGEEVAWQLVGGQPWAANADYLGQRKTRIRVNVDLPISSPRVLELVCHEAYPGHHTESVCKDAALVQPAGREELSVYVYPSPQALISEGLASYATEAVLGDEADQLAAECLRPTGLRYDGETARVVREAETLLLPVRSNIALMLDRGASSAQAHDYARTWLLEEAELLDTAIKHLETSSWRAYESCYPVGLALCRRYLTTAGGRFHDLLQRQLTPADLAR